MNFYENLRIMELGRVANKILTFKEKRKTLKLLPEKIHLNIENVSMRKEDIENREVQIAEVKKLSTGIKRFFPMFSELRE